MKRFDVADLYEKKYTGTISRYGKELERLEARAERDEMVRRMLLQRMQRQRMNVGRL